MQTVDLLREAAVERASDLHLVPGCSPLVRIDGVLIPLTGYPVLPHKQCLEMINQVLTEEQRTRLGREYNLDFTINLEQTRFRANIFYQRNGIEAVFRIIPLKIPSPEELMFPIVLARLADLTRGLVVVTGPTGSGKSTTIACLAEMINQHRRGNIITIEDPIEFIYTNKKCVVSQREIGVHTPNFATALKYVVRQDPDVVVIGEMRDYETIAAALSLAETGHMVFATLHAIDASQAVDRILDVFPGRQQQQLRTQLAGVLKAVVAQTLMPRADGQGRLAAREIMIVTPGIANLIRQGKSHEIYSAIEMGAPHGMISLERALADLVKRGLIDPDLLPARANAPDAMNPKRRSTDLPGPPAAA